MNGQDSGRNFGFGKSAGPQALSNIFNNHIAVGMMIGAPTTASAQLTGTGATAIRVNIDKGVYVLDGDIIEAAAQADVVLVNASSFMASGQSVIVDVIVYKSLGDLTYNQIAVAGAVATDGQEVPPTLATIQAKFAPGTVWYRIGRTKVNRSADTTLVQTYNNKVRPLLLDAATA